MAFKKYVKKGKKAYKFAKKHQGTAEKALALGMKLKRMINVEYKFYDISAAPTVSNTGTVYNLFSPTQGDGVTQRDGDSVKVLSLSGRIHMLMNAAASASLMRVIIFRGKQENAVSYTTTDILQNASILNPKNDSEKFRSKILYDKIFTLTTGDRTRNQPGNWYFRLNGHVNFVNGATTVENGGIYMLLISNEAVNTPTFSYYLRTRYTDN